MIEIKNTYLQLLDYDMIAEDEELIISECIIHEMNFPGVVFQKKVTIHNCVIDKFIIYSCWFKGGLLFTNNIVLSDVDYQMGGHNEADFVLEGNIFTGFFSFFDCQFDENVILRNNIFKKNSDLLAKENKGFDNQFEHQLIIENNMGCLDVLCLVQDK